MNSNKLHRIQASIDEVTKALKAINPNKACVPDQTPGRILKECAPEIAPSLTRLINLYKLVPRTGKALILFLCLKKGKKDEVTNYRPISVLSLVSKITEPCVFEKRFDFIAYMIHRKLLLKVEPGSTLSNKFRLCCSFFIKLSTCHATNLLLCRHLGCPLSISTNQLTAFL